MGLTVKISVDLADASKKVKALGSDKALGQFMATEAKAGMSSFVPFLTGQTDGTAFAEPFAVNYITPYAKYIYNGERMSFNRAFHPNAGAKWGERYAAAKGSDLARAVTNYLRR